MDPLVALELCDQAISDGDITSATNYLEGYLNWRGASGFEPIDVASSGKSGDVFAAECKRRINDWR